MKSYPITKSRRVRSTPFTSRIEKQGVTAYTVYNHMLLPAAFGSIEDSCEHLKKDVQVWDVAAERQVEIFGEDAANLVQLMTCTDLSKSMGSTLKFDYKVDKELIGGLKLQLGSIMIDTSIKNKLKKYEQVMLEN